MLKMLKPSDDLSVSPVVAFIAAGTLAIALAAITFTLVRVSQSFYYATYPLFEQQGVAGMVAVGEAAILSLALSGFIIYILLSRRKDVTGFRSKATMVGAFLVPFAFLLGGMCTMVLGAAGPIWVPGMGVLLMIIGGVIPWVKTVRLRRSAADQQDKEPLVTLHPLRGWWPSR
jgi:hypothetical protein